MTRSELCRAIFRMMAYLPADAQAALKRTYEKTWLLVCLHHDRLATPTRTAGGRLLDLWRAVEAERQEMLKRRASLEGGAQ
jgi:hypothetical protein